MKVNNFIMKKRVIVNLFLLLIAILAIVGCSVKIEKLNIKSPSIDKIPLRVGLYMSPELRKYTASPGGTAPTKFYIGEGLSIGAEMALKQVFKEVVIINNESEILNQNIKAGISFEILDVSGSFPPFVNTFKVTCRWTISGPDGKIYYNDTITGVGVDASFVGSTRVRESMTKAIEDQYKKFIEQMLLSGWWEKI